MRILKVGKTLLKEINEIKIIQFERFDVMRHPLVYKIIEKNYVSHLKWFNLTDPTIPDNIWDKYDAAP